MLSSTDSLLIDRLRDDLRQAAYTKSEVERFLGAAAWRALEAEEPALARRICQKAPGGALKTLTQFFAVADPVREDDLQAALPKLGFSGLAALGLVDDDAIPAQVSEGTLSPSARSGSLVGNGQQVFNSEGGEVREVRAASLLLPYQSADACGEISWWITSDLPERATTRELRHDHVMGVGGASRTLSGLMFTEEAEAALDVGTGCGIQALHASRFARQVVATDVSTRALEYARFNAGLNGVYNIEFRQGSFFEPVQGDFFDRIVSNPPFVITPSEVSHIIAGSSQDARAGHEVSYEYRDAGLAGDQVMEEVLQGVAKHLLPGGTAQFLGNWEYRQAADPFQRFRQAAQLHGLDLWVVEREAYAPLDYAKLWIRDGGVLTTDPRYPAALNAWLDDFETRTVRSIGFGYVMVRKPQGARGSLDASFARTEREHHALGNNVTSLGEHFSQCFAVHDWLVEHSEDLGEQKLKHAADVTEERHYRPGQESPSIVSLRQGAGLRRAVTSDAAISGFVGACTGELTVQQITDALKQLLELEEQDISESLLPVVRELLVTGFLYPVE